MNKYMRYHFSGLVIQYQLTVSREEDKLTRVIIFYANIVLQNFDMDNFTVVKLTQFQKIIYFA